MRTLLAVSFITLFISCSGKKKVPEGIIEPQKMQRVFWDYIRADVFAKDFIKKDSLVNDTLENIKLQNKIFSFYHVSRKDFYDSYNYYINHPELMDVIMDSMIAKQNRIKLQNQVRNHKKGMFQKDKRVEQKIIDKGKQINND